MLSSASSPDPARPLRVYRSGEALPEALRGSVAAIGNFDGVHRGHQALTAAARAEAERRGGPAAVLTFDPHPRSYFRPDPPIFRLTPEPVKLGLLAHCGIDGVFILRFDAALAATSAEEFVDRILARELGVAGVVVGHDFHFGRGRAGDPSRLADLCRDRGLGCIVVPAVREAGEIVSSSAIRAALEAGDVAAANRGLGYRWFVRAEVRHGQKLGRTLGYPTANLRLPDDCRLRHGIYAVRVAPGDGTVRDGVASFGRRPTFDNGGALLEAFLFDFADDLYGRTVDVELVGWIRGEERFDSAEALVERMHRDSAEAKALLAADRAPSAIGRPVPLVRQG